MNDLILFPTLDQRITRVKNVDHAMKVYLKNTDVVSLDLFRKYKINRAIEVAAIQAQGGKIE